MSTSIGMFVLLEKKSDQGDYEVSLIFLRHVPEIDKGLSVLNHNVKRLYF